MQTVETLETAASLAQRVLALAPNEHLYLCPTFMPFRHAMVWRTAEGVWIAGHCWLAVVQDGGHAEDWDLSAPWRVGAWDSETLERVCRELCSDAYRPAPVPLCSAELREGAPDSMPKLRRAYPLLFKRLKEHA